MIADFMRFYTYKLDEVLNMYAISFYSLVSSMHKLRGADNIEISYRTAASFAGGDDLSSYIREAKNQSEGAEKLLKQARILKKVKK